MWFWIYVIVFDAEIDHTNILNFIITCEYLDLYFTALYRTLTNTIWLSSMEYHLPPSIPGSVISHTLFLIYVKDLRNLPSNPVHCYAAPYKTPLDRIRTVQTLPPQLIWTYADLKTGDPKTSSMQWKLSVSLFLGASIETSQTYHLILTHCNSAIKLQSWALL